MELERKNSSTTIKKKPKRKLVTDVKREIHYETYCQTSRDNIPNFQDEATRRIIAPLEGMSGETV